MIILVLRTFIIYLMVIIVLRLMGKREIGQLQTFELVVILMISDLAAIPSEDVGIPLLRGVIPILVLLLTNITIAFISLKSEKARVLINGVSAVIVQRGKILEAEMKKNCYNLNDLLEELRMKNVPNIADVEFAILENNGQLSVFPKSQKRPVTPEDLKINTSFEGLPHVLIMDGKLHESTLQETNKDLTWLKSQLRKHGINRIEDVLLASLDSSGTLYLQAKEAKK